MTRKENEDDPPLSPDPGLYDQDGQEEDLSFARKEKEPGVFEIRVERHGVTLTETYRCFYPTRWGLDRADLQDMEDLLDRMIRRIREETRRGSA